MGTLRRSKQRTDGFLLARPAGSLSNFKESSKRACSQASYCATTKMPCPLYWMWCTNSWGAKAKAPDLVGILVTFRLSQCTQFPPLVFVFRGNFLCSGLTSNSILQPNSLRNADRVSLPRDETQSANPRVNYISPIRNRLQKMVR